MGYAFQKRGRWYVCWNDVSGRRRKKATSARTKVEARRLAEDIERQAASGSVSTPSVRAATCRSPS